MLKIQNTLKYLKDASPRRRILQVAFGFLIAAISLYVFFLAEAAISGGSIEAETANLSGNAAVSSDELASGGSAIVFASNPMLSKSYQIDQSNFANPERGFSLYDGNPLEARQNNMSLSHEYFRMDAFKNQPLSNAFLQQVDATFVEARSGGIKIVPRFTYNFPASWPINPAIDGDAPIGVVRGHIAQLKPLLQEHADIIAYMEAGFVGAWGEWHSSTNNLTSIENKKIILDDLMKAIPDRAIGLRYQRDKIAIYNRATPINSNEAFNGSPFSRTAHINDCFLASEDDWGTYDLNGTLDQQKSYLGADNLYVPQGGETCNDASDAQPYIGCSNAQNELQRMRWSQLNSAYHPGVLNLWKSQGCYDTIAKRLGYRLHLKNASVASSVSVGEKINGTVTIENTGYAAPYNPRDLELVARHTATGKLIKMPLPNDPRRWTPGETQTLIISTLVPVGSEKGTYDLALNLPDPVLGLRDRSEYSIRLANLNTWEQSTGYNMLGLQLVVR